jgi:hypothetical protein
MATSIIILNIIPKSPKLERLLALQIPIIHPFY